MSSPIEIPEHLLPFFPETVPILDEDEVGEIFVNTICHWMNSIFHHEYVWDFVDDIIFEGYYANINAQQTAELWNDVMQRLGYTEISPR